MVMRDAGPQCDSQRFKKNSHIHNGKQHHQGKDCGRQGVLRPENRVIDQDPRSRVERLLLENIALHGICRAVGVRTADGQISDVIDVRHSVSIEIEYDVLQSGYQLLPRFTLYNEAGVKAIQANDLDPTWRRRPRPAGRYVSTGWIPGNLLSEGTFMVSCSVVTLDPVMRQFVERDAVAFQVVDSLDGDSARGDWGGGMNAAVRPLLQWSTRFSTIACNAAPRAHSGGNCAEAHDA